MFSLSPKLSGPIKGSRGSSWLDAYNVILQELTIAAALLHDEGKGNIFSERKFSNSLACDTARLNLGLPTSCTLRVCIIIGLLVGHDTHSIIWGL